MVMLTFKQAREIGIEACVDRLGRDFVMEYRDTSCPQYADLEDHAYCFVGVDNTENRYDDGPLVLTSVASGSGSSWPYFACCNVSYSDGAIEFLDCMIPA